MDVQNSLLHLPKPQSKHTFIFKATTHKTKKQQICFLVYGCANASLNKFLFARAKTPIQTHFHLHSCYPQTKNVPPRVQKQNFSNWMFCTVHVQCTHSASYSARPQNAVNTMGLAVFGQFTQKKQTYCLFCLFSSCIFLGKHMVFTVFCGRALCRALCRALYVHRAKHDVCAPLYFHQQNAAILPSRGVEAHSALVHRARHTAFDLQCLPTCGAYAAMLLLCLWVAAVKMKMCLDWGFGTCKREIAQACVCTFINQKAYLLLLCLVGSRVAALKMKVCLD